MKRIPIVFFQGAFDILNACHIRAFEEIVGHPQAHGHRLVIGLNTDRLISEYKQRRVIMPYEQRARVLLGLRYVHDVIPVDEATPLRLLDDLKPEIYALGSEWSSTKREAEQCVLNNGGKMLLTTTYKDTMHSSDIRQRVLETSEHYLSRVSAIVKTWNVKMTPEFRAFKCGRCLSDIVKAWHVWFEDDGVRCEVHFCDACYQAVMA